MARKKRVISKTGIYHVILRGNNKQLLFEDNDDYAYFLSRLSFYTSVCACELYAYCLMDNHVHLLLKSGPESVSTFVKRLSNSYVYWFNHKYNRIGHLFQGRFKSEPVDDKRYFLTVLRYIHNNPVRAGVVGQCADYPYCSYSEYLGNAMLISASSNHLFASTGDFIRFHDEVSDDSGCLDISDKNNRRISDRDAITHIRSVLTAFDLTINQLQSLSRKVRNDYLQQFRNIGISINQLSRITGISCAIIKHIPRTVSDEGSLCSE